MSFNPGLVRYDQPQARAFYRDVVAANDSAAGRFSRRTRAVHPAGRQRRIDVGRRGRLRDASRPGSTVRFATASWTRGIGAPCGRTVVRGRAFDERDTPSSPAVAIVNETMAGRYWPSQDAIGKTLRLRDRSGPVIQVVGIARDGKYGEIAEAPQPYLFLPFSQRFRPMMTMVVLAKGDAAALTGPIRAEVQAVGASVPMFDIRTLEDIYQSRAMGPARLTSTVMTALGLPRHDPGGRRTLRRDRVSHDAAHARDRGSDGARRRAAAAS